MNQRTILKQCGEFILADNPDYNQQELLRTVLENEKTRQGNKNTTKIKDYYCVS